MEWVRIVDLAQRHREVAPEVEAAVLQVLRSGRYVGGPTVAEAERVAAQWFGRRRAVGVNSGTDALMLALQAVGVGPGDEVIVPALTFFATAGAVGALGATPVVVDVSEDGCMDPDRALAAVTSNTRAVIPVHLFGSLCPLPNVDLPVVDDAAQAIGGAPPRSVGVLSAVSCYPTKIWGAAGDGGFVVGDDPELLDRVRRLANHGMTESPHLHEKIGAFIGRNSRLDAVQAAILVAHATRLSARLERRRAIAARFDAELSCAPFPRGAGSPVQVYAVCVRERELAIERLREAHIEAAVYYPRSLSQQPALRPNTFETPVADRLCTQLLTLPCHAGMDDQAVDRVVSAMRPCR